MGWIGKSASEQQAAQLEVELQLGNLRRTKSSHAMPTSLAKDIALDCQNRELTARLSRYAQVVYTAGAGAKSAQTPTARAEAAGRAVAVARLEEMFGPLGRVASTAGFSGVPLPLRMRRAEAAASRAAGGPASVTTAALVAARGGVPGAAAPVFSRSPRWACDGEATSARGRAASAWKEVCGGGAKRAGPSGGGGVATPAQPGAPPAPSPQACSDPLQPASDEEEGGAALAWALPAMGAPRWRVAGACAGGEEDAWEGVELADSKEPEPPSPAAALSADRGRDGGGPSAASPPPAAATPPVPRAARRAPTPPPEPTAGALSAWAAREAARLRALGARRAAERLFLGGAPATPLPGAAAAAERAAVAAARRARLEWPGGGLPALAAASAADAGARHARARRATLARSAERAARAAAGAAATAGRPASAPPHTRRAPAEVPRGAALRQHAARSARETRAAGAALARSARASRGGGGDRRRAPVPTTAPRVQRAHATGQPSREAERAAARREWGLLAREKPAFRPESRALREWREARRFDLGAGEGGDY
jgi:hypothetical protein